ncbi:hypothetical protein GCM10011367_25390 [Marinicauda pacifica]|nr:hypothetical protein GCM10011367_25390 [Marinicauda pacifica]
MRKFPGPSRCDSYYYHDYHAPSARAGDARLSAGGWWAVLSRVNKSTARTASGGDIRYNVSTVRFSLEKTQISAAIFIALRAMVSASDS